MNAVVERSLAAWGLSGAKYALAAARENAVYRVDAKDRTLAFRLHRKGYRTSAELWSELAWMDAARRGGLNVPHPIRSLNGAFLEQIDGLQVDALTWLPGAPLQTRIGTLPAAKRAQMFSQIGHQMARLHQISDAWTFPDGFTRCAWDRKGLVGEQPLWDRFWDNPYLTSEDRQLFNSLRAHANAALVQREGGLDYGLIHADLVSLNIIVDRDQLFFIDFDDGGFGFRVFELATTLLKFIDDVDYPDLRAALIAGYTSVRPLPTDTLDLFLALRSATYVGWNIARMAEAGGGDRNQRFIATARRLARGVLANV